jgi:hypothetical protein
MRKSSVKLELNGEERLLFTKPRLRQIDSNGRVFVSKNYVGKEVLMLLIDPIDEDFKNFNPIAKTYIL